MKTNKLNCQWVVGVLSAQAYEHRRSACRRTWVAEAAAHSDVEIVFIVGGGPALKQAIRDDDVLTVPCCDDYDSLPQKIYGFLNWALENFDFQVAFKCDDDTYVHLPRLMRYEMGNRDYVGADLGGYASGGAGYCLSARAARALLPDLKRRLKGSEDVIVGELLRERGVALTGSGLFRPYFGPGNYPTPANQIITGHYVQPDKMIEIHSSLQASTCNRSKMPYHILDWETGWGVLGLNGAIGHEVDGATEIQRPDIALDWSPYEFLSGHVDCRIELQLEQPMGIFGFMEGHAWNAPDAPVTFSVDSAVSGVLVGPGERTAECRLPAGRHVLHMTTQGAKTRRYPVWALRELADTDSLRIGIPTSNGYVSRLSNTLLLLRRYWPDHPPVDVVHHERSPDSADVRAFFAGPQSKISWCEAMTKYLVDGNQDELVLLLLDDYGLCQPVDTKRVTDARTLMTEDLSVSAFFLTWMMLPSATPYPRREDVIIWPRWSYSTHTQAALWRRASLLRTLRRIGRGSIEDFELEGSKMFNEHEFAWEKHVSFRVPAPPSPSLFLDSCDKTYWPIGYHNLYHRGQPDPRHESFLRAHELLSNEHRSIEHSD